MDGSTSQEKIESYLLDPTSIQDRNEFASALTRLRNRVGLSVRTVAKQLDQPAATIGGYFSGQHLPSVSQTALFRELINALGVEDDAKVLAWVDALSRVRQKPGPRPSTHYCPYPGLESFKTEDSTWFFGREELTELVVSRLSGLIRDGKPATLVLVGASGSGKSSLINAGVVPAAVKGRPGREQAWEPVFLCPGEDPPASLAAAMAEATGQKIAAIRSNPIWQWPGPMDGSGRGLLLIVDQFEEIFTTCCDGIARQSFIQTIVQLSSSPAVAVLLGLRADFYARATQEPDLVPMLQDNQVVVGPLSSEGVRQAIVEPARQSSLAVEDDLVELLMDEVAPRSLVNDAHEAGVLPLLSHALRETWEKSRRGTMTVSDYRSTGGIANAVQKSAERTYLELSKLERVLARRVMLRLVNAEDTITRRRARWSSLPGCTCCHDDLLTECSLHRVINCFVSARLLTAEEETVEISHEALLSAWDRLREWIEGDVEGIRLRRQIGEAARMWDDSDRDAAALLRGGRLELARVWFENRDPADLTSLETSFLQASAAQDEAEKQASRRRLRRFQGLSAAAAALAIAAAVLVNLAVGARNDATEARDTAQSRQIAIQAAELRNVDSSLASQLALLAFQIAPTQQARSALLDSSALPSSTRILGRPGPTAVALSPAGTILAVTGAGDASVRLFTLGDGALGETGLLQVPGVEADLYSVTFSPDGALVATAGTDGLVRLWSVKDPSNPKLLGEPLAGFEGSAWSAEFSPDGATLATAGEAALIYRWDVNKPEHPAPLAPLEGAGGITQTFVFSPDGSLAAAGGTDGVVRLWSMAADGPRLVHELPTGTGTTVTSLAFSPDARILAAGSKDKLIRLWRLDRAGPAAVEPPLGGFGSWVNDVAFSQDGNVLAGGGSDNSIRFWSVDGWQPLEAELSTSSPVTQLAFRPGGTDLVSVASDGTARLWAWPGAVILGATDNVFGLSYSADGSRLAVLSNKSAVVGIWDTSDRLHPNRLGRVQIPTELQTVGGTGALSPDGKLLATGMTAPPGTTDYAVQVWDVNDPARPIHQRTLTGPTALIEGILFSPDGRFLAAGGDDATIRLWDLTDASIATPAVTLEGASGLILGMDFSPDGRLLAAAVADKSVWLWDVSNRLNPKLLEQIKGFDNYAYSVAFSPDGSILAAGSADKTVRLWDVKNPSKPKPLAGPLSGPGNYVFSVAFSPTEPVLSAAVTDGTVWQWNVENPSQPEPLTTLNAAATTQVFAVRYSPDGRELLGSDGKAVRLWEPDPARASRLVCSTAGDGITRKEWKQYVPGLPYDPPCMR